MANILVTGAAGFIGSHVADALLKRGDTVIAVDNFNDYYDKKRKEKNVAHNLKKNKYKLYRSDVMNMGAMHHIFMHNKIDAVIHLAARAGVRYSLEQPVHYMVDNVVGTTTLLDLCSKFNVKKFLLGSSSSVYGNNKKVPFAEDHRVDQPISPYAASKQSIEKIAYTFHHIHNMHIACLRFFTVYGPRGRPDMAPYMFTEKILQGKPITRFGDGSTARDYTFVKDIVDGIVKCLDADFKYEIINLGNNTPVKLNDFIATIEKVTGKKAKIAEKPIPQGDVNITYADISKAQKVFNYQPTTSLEEGMKSFLEWYKLEVGRKKK